MKTATNILILLIVLSSTLYTLYVLFYYLVYKYLNPWQKLDTTKYSPAQLYNIIDDGLTHGFEFKYINNTWYYRERG